MTANSGPGWRACSRSRRPRDRRAECGLHRPLRRGGRSAGLAAGEWVEERVDLAQYAGSEILVRFDMMTDDALNEPGLCIDNLAVDAIGWQDEDTDSDDGWRSVGLCSHQQPGTRRVRGAGHNAIPATRWRSSAWTPPAGTENGGCRILEASLSVPCW